MSNSHRVRFGNLILSDGGDPNANDTDYTFSIAGDSFTTGDPQPVEVVIQSRLQDGSLVTRTRDENREASFVVTIGGANSRVLAEGLAALLAETNKRNEFSWTPPDGWGAETIYDVVTSSLSKVEDDLAEVMRNERSYTLRLVCEPFGRSAAQESIAPPPATSVTPTVTVIDPASATTAWTASVGTLIDAGTYLRVASSNIPTWRWTGSSSLSGTPYISLLINANPSNWTLPTLKVNGILATLVAQFAEGAATRYYWQTAETSATTLEFSTKLVNSGFGTGYNLAFAMLQRSDLLPSGTTARESLRALPIKGTARSQGSFEVSHASSGLGTVLLYTCPSGEVNYSPALRAFRAGGGAVTADANSVSGFTETMTIAPYFEVPVSQLLPGKHQLVAILKRSSAGAQAITWTAQVYIGGTAIGSVWSGSTTLSLTTSFATYLLGNTTLPMADVPATSTAVVRITLGGSSAVSLDEMFAFQLDAGALSWIEAGPHKRVWVDTATVDVPRPTAYIGDAADRSDAFYPGVGVLVSRMDHRFTPSATAAYLVTTGALSAAAVYYYSPAWHYEAAE